MSQLPSLPLFPIKAFLSQITTLLTLLTSSFHLCTAIGPIDPLAPLDEYLIPYDLLEGAESILTTWISWSKPHRSSDPEDYDPDPEHAPMLPGDPCSVPSTVFTLQVLYFRRFQHTLKLRPAQEYYLIRHLAERINGYKRKMGDSPPPTPEHVFCKAPDYHDWDFSLTNKHSFLWPPTLDGEKVNYLMCENSRCTPCDRVQDPYLIEACDLTDLYPDGWWSDISQKHRLAQQYYPPFRSLRALLSSQQELSSQVSIEGATCSASPAQTLSFARLMKLLVVRNVSSLESHQIALEEISQIELHFTELKTLLQEFQDGSLSSSQFCSIYLDPTTPSLLDPTHTQEWMIGGLVCGGSTCKPCKESPVNIKEGPQHWSYESGLLNQACKILSELHDSARAKEALLECFNGSECPVSPKDTCATIIDPPHSDLQIHPNTDFLVTFPRLEEAEELLHLWYTWLRTPGKEKVKHGEGDRCNVSPEATLRLMYLRRFWYTLDLRPGRKYKVTRHLAERLEFYRIKMGAPPSAYKVNQFCSFPRISRTPDFPSDNGLFTWPPRPYHLMCEDNSCVPCEKVKSAELKEACDLITPPSDEWWKSLPPEELSAQIAYLKLPHLRSALSNPTELSKQKKVEGQECSATAKQTLAYATLLKKFKLNEVTNRASHVEALEEIIIVKRNLVPFTYLLENYERRRLFSYHFCPIDLEPPLTSNALSPSSDPNLEEYWVKGAYVCGAGSIGDNGTCKPCKVTPLNQRGFQEWNYQRGELHDACKLLTELHGGARPEEDKCKDCDHFDPCDKIFMRNNSRTVIYGWEEIPRRYLLNYDRWKAKKGGSSARSCTAISHFIIASACGMITRRLITRESFLV